MEKISVIGCGWLGLPLAASLARQGYTVKGSVTSEARFQELIQHGVLPYVFLLADAIPEETKKDLFATDAAVVSVAPIKGKPAENLFGFAKLSARLEKAGVKKVVLVSSTGVYPELNRVVTEGDAASIPSGHSGAHLLDLENAFRVPDRELVVIRFGGLFGPGRHPGNWFRDKSVIASSEAPVNMIHLDDCIGVIRFFLEQFQGSGVFNAVSPVHPTKKEFYSAALQSLGLPIPNFDPEPGAFKEVSSEALIRAGYTFIHPDPVKAL